MTPEADSTKLEAASTRTESVSISSDAASILVEGKRSLFQQVSGVSVGACTDVIVKWLTTDTYPSKVSVKIRWGLCLILISGR